MAKKKKGSRSSGRSSGGSSRTATRRPPSRPQTGRTQPEEPSTVKPAPATPGGPSRTLRKEEARRQREALRRRMARRRRLRVGGAVLAVLVAVAGITAYFVLRETAAEAAGCTGVRRTDEYPGGQDQAHIGAQGGPATPPALSTYPSTPPASGPHAASTLPAGVYDTAPDIHPLIHSLEHGAVAVWYDPALAESPAVREIKRFYSDPGENDHVIVAPYDYPDQGAAGTFPEGSEVALVAWRRVQTCEDASLDAVRSFVGNFRNRGEAPEAGAQI